MSAFTVVNSTTFPAQLIINKGTPGGPNNLFGRVAVAANNGSAVIPTTEAYTAQASITMEDGNTYTTSVVNLPNGTQNLTAQMLVEGGTFNFQIVAQTGSTPNQFTLVNTCRQPVTFNLTATPTSPLGKPILTSAVVVSQLDSVAVSTEESYSFQANVNGITTSQVATNPAQTGQDLTITIFQDNVPVGDWAAYSVSVN
ncbi:hypothetical protein OVA11_19710 [Caulobacter sp. SL161]|uniref:hypothetical protein n=1 Tax=Caulobacter sp. SL161 TaxID=2995156 RepID=UPI0022725A43|nr:hypothetical protein [Caulobacter sp. SL161]MCY1649202.1 hypothetical protein [Caulobacter sp. SL161]